MQGIVDVRVLVEVNGQKVSEIVESVDTLDALDLEQKIEELKKRAGRAILEQGLTQLGEWLGRPCCCGRPMKNLGRRARTVMCHSGEATSERTRYHCSGCRATQTPADPVICCGSHRITRLLGKNITRLATLEPFQRLPQLVPDQHGIDLAFDAMWELDQDVGGSLERQRLVCVK